MKRLSVILLAAMLIAIPSCKNQKKAQETKDLDLSTAENIVSEELKVDVANLVESAKKMKRMPFAEKTTDGKFALTEKEKMVKPDYLISPSKANDLVTLSQKYRTVAMLGIDIMITNIYGIPNTDYKEAVSKLLVDINDPALTDYAGLDWSLVTPEEESEYLSEFIDEEYEQGRPQFFWEGVAASLVEQLYICTRDVDKFMPMFTDQVAADVTYNFVCVHEGLIQMIKLYPEMEGLNTALEPLYVINAISVAQLKEQLLQLKGDIEAARAYLLK